MKSFLFKSLNALTIFSLVSMSYFIAPVKKVVAEDPNYCEPVTLISGDVAHVESGIELPFLALHENWTTEIDGAGWVWMGNEDSFDFAGEVEWSIENPFTFSGDLSKIKSVKLWVAADNSYTVSLNENEIISSLDEDNFTDVIIVDVDKSSIVVGENLIEFKVKNFAQDGGTIETNPTGVLYRFEIECEEIVIPEPVTCPAIQNITENVYPDGEVVNVSLPMGQYKITASGTYKYRTGEGSDADAAFSLRRETEDLPEENYFEDTLWYQSSTTGHLGIKVNGEIPKDIWGSTFNEDHTYTYILDHDGGDVVFQITDDQYNDNSGHLTIEIECFIPEPEFCSLDFNSIGGRGGMIKVSKKHPSWTNLEGAEWVWNSANIPVFPDRRDGGVFEITEVIHISGNPEDSIIKIAADNVFSVIVNNDNIFGDDPNLWPEDIVNIESSQSKFNKVYEYTIPASYLVSGENTIVIRAVNQKWPETDSNGNPIVITEANININPAGVIYGLTINYYGYDCEYSDNNEVGSHTPVLEKKDNEDNVTPSNSSRAVGSGGRSILMQGEVAGVSDSKVLGECVAFEKYHKKGDKGGEIARIQEFLNDHMNAGLTVDGVYGNATVKAVHAFQQKYFQQIISPWVPPLLSKTTGRWYKTTKMMANEIIDCPEPEVFLEDPAIMYKVKLENN